MPRSGRFRRFALLSALAWVGSGCVDNGREPRLSQVDTVPPAAGGPQSNQNIANPTLTVAENFSVSPGDTLTLVWSDEFDGARVDPANWFFATGDGSEVGLPGGWGNNELQYYLPDSAQVENGVLRITARRESVGGLAYTSARLNTEDRFAFRYGRIEASIKLPRGQGLWPAFWMLSQDSPYGTWAATGEIDIMEAINLGGTGGNEIFGTLHYGAPFPGNVFTSNAYTPSVDVTADFHTYALEWDETEIRWYFDDVLYAVQNSWFSSAADYPAPFDQPFHILLNLAVGGNLPGNPDADTVFPATMEVDWVRVYTGEDNTPPTSPQQAAPAPTQDPADVISLYSDAYANVAIDAWPTGWSGVGAVADITVDGELAKEHANVDFVGVEFVSAPLDVSGMTHFHIDVWTPDATSFLIKFVDFGGDGFGGGNDTEGPLTFDANTTPALTTGQWVSLDIPLADMQAAGLASLADLNQMVFSATTPGEVTVFVDNLYFYDAGSN